VQGSDTQWYKNVREPIDWNARGVEAEFRAVPVTAAKALKAVVEKFREKYGANDVKKYHLEVRCSAVGTAEVIPPADLDEDLKN
jgi:hypothetical protein